MAPADHRAWWASLTEQQRREHNLKSALGTFKTNLGEIESVYNHHGLSAGMTLQLTARLNEALLLMEAGAGNFSLHLFRDVRATRERVTRLRLRAESDRRPVLS